jgi:hypothetical protein
MSKQNISQSYLQFLFEYRDGNFYRKVCRNYRHPIGSLAGTSYTDGYWAIMIDKSTYTLHRLVWIYFNGDIPDGAHIDHINRDRKNNRIENLRLAPNGHLDNAQNKTLEIKNTSGFVGVNFHKKNKKWTASIGVNGKRIYLGSFSSAEGASEAYVKAKKELHLFSPELR